MEARRTPSTLYAIIVRVATLISCVISASILGFAAAFGGAFAVYSVRLLTDTLLTNQSLADDPVDDPTPTTSFYFYLPGFFNSTLYPYDSFNATLC